jgi:hypothetical protein
MKKCFKPFDFAAKSPLSAQNAVCSVLLDEATGCGLCSAESILPSLMLLSSIVAVDKTNKVFS